MDLITGIVNDNTPNLSDIYDPKLDNLVKYFFFLFF